MGLDAREMLNELGGSASPPEPVVVPMRAPSAEPGPRGTPGKGPRRRPARASARGGAAEAVSAAARGLAEELAVEPKQKGTAPKVPTAPEWERWLGKVLYWCSVLYVWWLLEGTDDEGNEALEKELTLSREDGVTMARPIAKRLAGTVFNKKWGRKVLDSDDLFEAFLVLGSYAMTTRKYLRRRIGMGRIIPGPWNDRSPNLEVKANGETVATGSGEGSSPGTRAPGIFGNGHVPVFDQGT